jgi:ceramide glucosyltransferase
VHDGGRAINPKVSNLRAMLEGVSHDVVVISDSNVSAHASYLAEMVEEMADERVGIVTNLFAGTDEQTFGSTLENLHLNGPIAGAVALSAVTSDEAFVIGKSMMFRRSLFERLGGFAAVGHVLAEDYVMRRMFSAAGYSIRLSRGVLRNVCVRTTFSGFLKRQIRWSLMRSRLQPLLYPLEVLANPVAMALLAPLFGYALGWSLLWAFALILFRDAHQWWRLRGIAGSLRALPLGLFKELLLLGVWVAAPFFRHVSWRGRRVRLSAGTHLYAQEQIGRAHV